MKIRKNKKITTTVMAMIFALAITMPATSQTAQAAEAPFYKEMPCLVGGMIGAVGAGMLAAAFFPLAPLILVSLLIPTAATGGCFTTMLLGHALNGLLNSVPSHDDFLKRSDSVLNDPVDNEKVPSNPDQPSDDLKKSSGAS